MEYTTNDFAESTDSIVLSEIHQSNFFSYDVNSPDPEDEEEDANDDENEGEKKGNKGSNDDDPPLDKDVVHSPVEPKPGKPN